MRIVQIKDDYIELLIREFPHVMDNKRFHRNHTRKYIGVVFKVGEFTYYAPFSSPKPKDFKPDGNVKRSDLFCLRMLEDGENGVRKLLGTVKLNNMIPIPEKYIEDYSIDDEPDEKYRDVVKAEFKWLSENSSRLSKAARTIYYFKKSETKNKNDQNCKVYDAILPFEEIEKIIFNTLRSVI